MTYSATLPTARFGDSPLTAAAAFEAIVPRPSQWSTPHGALPRSVREALLASHPTASIAEWAKGVAAPAFLVGDALAGSGVVRMVHDQAQAAQDAMAAITAAMDDGVPAAAVTPAAAELLAEHDRLTGLVAALETSGEIAITSAYPRSLPELPVVQGVEPVLPAVRDLLAAQLEHTVRTSDEQERRRRVERRIEWTLAALGLALTAASLVLGAIAPAQ